MTLEMASGMMRGLQQAVIFSGLRLEGDLTYCGTTTAKILRFDITGETGGRPFFMTSIISREEKMAWQAFQDLLDHAAGLAQKEMTGLFGLEILSVDIQDGVRHFHAGDFGKLLVNHARQLAPDGKTLIRYGQLFGLLHKRVPADWGKIEVRTFVEIVDPKKVRCELFVRKLLRETAGTVTALYVIRDMSSNPIWDVTGPEIMAQKSQETGDKREALPEIYFLHPSLKTPRRLIGAC